LERVLADGYLSGFRNKWHGERLHDLLLGGDIGWAYDMLYAPLSSHVHADVLAGQLFARLGKPSVVTIALMIYGCGVHTLVETFSELSLSSKEKGLLNKIVGKMKRS
jgi:hypothetical protein